MCAKWHTFLLFAGIYTIKQTVMFIFKKSKCSARKAFPKPAAVTAKVEKHEAELTAKKTGRKQKPSKPEADNEEKNTDKI